MSTGEKSPSADVKISVLDRHIVKSDNIILTRNEGVGRGAKIMIFCILDRGVQRVIKVVGAENVVKSRILR